MNRITKAALIVTSPIWIGPAAFYLIVTMYIEAFEEMAEDRRKARRRKERHA